MPVISHMYLFKIALFVQRLEFIVIIIIIIIYLEFIGKLH